MYQRKSRSIFWLGILKVYGTAYSVHCGTVQGAHSRVDTNIVREQALGRNSRYKYTMSGNVMERCNDNLMKLSAWLWSVGQDSRPSVSVVYSTTAPTQFVLKKESPGICLTGLLNFCWFWTWLEIATFQLSNYQIFILAHQHSWFIPLVQHPVSGLSFHNHNDHISRLSNSE